MYSATARGEFGICGISDPIAEAIATSRSSTSAVRIERRVRQANDAVWRRVMRRRTGAGCDMGTARCYRRALEARRVPQGGASRRVNCPVAIKTPTSTRIEPETAAIAA